MSSEIHPLLFEISEDGVKTGHSVAVTIFATKRGHTEYAECLVTEFLKIGDRVALNMFSASTLQGTITNLTISANSISFDMVTYLNRSLRFAATATSKVRFQASAVGVWITHGTPAKLVKTEWKQVNTINLPSSAIAY